MNSFSVSDIAKSIYVSERRIREYFLNVNGISISDFITNYRMQKAFELIKSSKYKIQEIMEMVGYDTEHGFRNAFTKFYGNPPSHYIKKK
jgi:two-component system response regulator YesN